jgi:hypothetical protein
VTSHNPDRSQVILAVITASLMLFAFGLIHRALASRQAAPVNTVPLDSAVLKGFPSQIASWKGQDIPVSEALIDATGVDAYINRQYLRANGLATVTLYIACGANVNGIMAHSPTGCYRTAGWQITARRSMEVRVDERTSIPCFLYEFCREGAGQEHVSVLHYCFANGEYFNEVKQVLARGWRQLRAIPWAAQVEIVASDGSLRDSSAAEQVCAFAHGSALEITHMFESIEKTRVSDGPCSPEEGK